MDFSAPKGGLCAVLLPCKQAPLVCHRHSWKEPPDTAHTTHPPPMAYKRPVQFREIPVLPRPEEKKKNKKTKESILPKQCLHKSLSFSFFLEVV